MASAPKPTILLIHGGFHSPFCWTPLRTSLSAHHFPSAAVALPSIGSSEPAGALVRTDVAAVRAHLDQLVNVEGKDVVLVMHSYGGVAGAGAVEGLERKRRRERGERGGVVACLFVAALLVPRGKDLVSCFSRDRAPDLVVDPDDERFFKIPDPHELFYNDVSREVSRPYIEALRPHPVSGFTEPVEWPEVWSSGLVPCTYLMTGNDNALPTSVQEAMVEERKKENPELWTVEKVDSGHSVWLSQPKVVLDLIVRIADKHSP